MSLVGELWDFLKTRKKFWLAPILLFLVILSGMVVLGTSSPALSMLIYPFF